jgi:hypothetical protein
VRDPSFNYRFFEKNFELEKELWHPTEPRKKIRGYDIKKMITERIAYVDSRSEILIQVVDILASFLRRLLSGEIMGDDIARALGRLQIIKGRRWHPPIAPNRDPFSRLFKTVTAMTQAGRSMMTAERTLSRKRQSINGA